MKLTVELANGDVFEAEEVAVPPMERKATEDAMARRFMQPASFAMRTADGKIVHLPQDLMRTAIVTMEW